MRAAAKTTSQPQRRDARQREGRDRRKDDEARDPEVTAANYGGERGEEGQESEGPRKTAPSMTVANPVRQHMPWHAHASTCQTRIPSRRRPALPTKGRCPVARPPTAAGAPTHGVQDEATGRRAERRPKAADRLEPGDGPHGTEGARTGVGSTNKGQRRAMALVRTSGPMIPFLLARQRIITPRRSGPQDTERPTHEQASWAPAQCDRAPHG